MSTAPSAFRLRWSRSALPQLLALVLLLAGAPAQGRERLVVWGLSTQSEWDRGTQVVTEEFERRYGVEIETFSPGDFGEQKALTAIAGGTPPDVLPLGVYTRDWLARGALQPLDAFIARDRDQPDGIHLEDYYPASLDHVTIDGKVYAIPDWAFAFGLYYNRALFAEAGLVDVAGQPKPPATWEEWYRDNQLLTRRDEQGRLTRVGSYPSGYAPSLYTLPELAWEFLKWYASAEAQELKVRETIAFTRNRGMPFTPFTLANRRLNQRIAQQYVLHNPLFPEKTRRIYAAFLDILDRATYRLPVNLPAGRLLDDELNRVFEAAVQHRQAPQQALNLAQARVQQALDLYRQEETLPLVPWSQLLLVGGLLGGGLLLWLGLKLRGCLRQLGGQRQKEALAGLLFVLPWGVGFVLLMAGPILWSLVLSFTRYSVLKPARWVGLENYVSLFTDDPLFWKSLGNTCFIMLGIPLGMGWGWAWPCCCSAPCGAWPCIAPSITCPPLSQMGLLRGGKPRQPVDMNRTLALIHMRERAHKLPAVFSV